MNSDKIFSVIGAMLINLFARPILYWGNISPYIMSYLAQKETLSQHPYFLLNSWFLLAYNLSWTCGMVSGDVIVETFQWIRPRFVIATGIAIFNSCFFGSVLVLYAGISWNLYVFVFGVAVGFGIGIFECLVIRYCVVDWADDDDRGFLTGLVVSSTSVGAAILNKFTTFWINPTNLSPDLDIGDGYQLLFSQREVTDKTPSLFLVLGATNLFLQFVGFCLVKERQCPPREIDSPGNYESFVDYDVNENTANSKTHTSTGGTNDGMASLREAESEIGTKDNNMKKSTLFEFARSSKFLITLFIYYCMTNAETTAISYYKVFGQLYIPDDTFLSNLGTTISIMSIFWSMFYGFYFDRFGSKTGLITLDVCLALFTPMMYITARVQKWAYFVITLLACGAGTSVYLGLIATSLDVFGKEHLGRNIGMLSMACFLNTATMSAFGEMFIPRFGWFSAFGFSESMGLVALIVIILKIRT